MKVSLLNFTGAMSEDPAAYAAAILIATKATRLNMSNASDYFEDVFYRWHPDKRRVELEYISNSIPSSWEFIDYTFIIGGVSRACAEQFKRNRQGSYAQQSLRIMDRSGFDYVTGPSVSENEMEGFYDQTMVLIDSAYNNLIDNGVAIEDARGILPLNIETNLVAKFNLRTLVEMLRKRDSARTQGEFRDLAAEMRHLVIEVHPWAEMFLNSKVDAAARELHDLIGSFEDQALKIKMAKLLDTIMAEV